MSDQAETQPCTNMQHQAESPKTAGPPAQVALDDSKTMPRQFDHVGAAVGAKM